MVRVVCGVRLEGVMGHRFVVLVVIDGGDHGLIDYGIVSTIFLLQVALICGISSTFFAPHQRCSLIQAKAPIAAYLKTSHRHEPPLPCRRSLCLDPFRLAI